MLPKETLGRERAKSVAFVDADGVTRHYMTLPQLNELYKMIEEFEADLTRDEFKPHSDAFVRVKCLLHKRMRH